MYYKAHYFLIINILSLSTLEVIPIYFIHMVKISYNVVLQHTFSQWLVQWYHVDLYPVKWQMIQIRHYFIVLLGLKKVMGKSTSKSEVVQSCLTLFDPRLLCPWDFPGPFPSSGDHSHSRDWTRVSRIVGKRIYRLSHQGSRGVFGFRQKGTVRTSEQFIYSKNALTRENTGL